VLYKLDNHHLTLLKCVSDDDQTRKVSEGRKGEKKNNRELEKLNLRREKKKKKERIKSPPETTSSLRSHSVFSLELLLLLLAATATGGGGGGGCSGLSIRG